jgi:hypothetical protein
MTIGLLSVERLEWYKNPRPWGIADAKFLFEADWLSEKILGNRTHFRGVVGHLDGPLVDALRGEGCLANNSGTERGVDSRL